MTSETDDYLPCPCSLEECSHNRLERGHMYYSNLTIQAMERVNAKSRRKINDIIQRIMEDE
jgi:hypothetical protein